MKTKLKSIVIGLLMIPSVLMANTEAVIYTQSGCEYCIQAERLLAKHHMHFRECNITTSSSCEREFRRLHADGTPVTVINGQVLKGVDALESYLGQSNQLPDIPDHG